MAKLPELKKQSQPLTLNLGGLDLNFRKYRVSDFATISSNKAFQSNAGSTEKMMVMIIAQLLDYDESTFEEKLDFIQNLELDSINELFQVAKVLGVNEEDTEELQKKIEN